MYDFAITIKRKGILFFFVTVMLVLDCKNWSIHSFDSPRYIVVGNLVWFLVSYDFYKQYKW